ncbi:MAG: outer membrane protein assembly factor BamD [Bacteroidetes bacterium]|nr:outer membrane protein assembly factor BamD [Bacteroidota bacterium]
MNRTIAVFLVILSGCSGGNRLRYDSPEEAYTKGMEYFDAGKYSRAVEYFQGAFDFGRTHAFAADAQFMLAKAQQLQGNYLLAANEYQRFMQLYRSDPRVEEAEYQNALTFFEQSPKYERDQTATEKSIAQFQLFIDRYPRSEHVSQADSLIRVQREKLAHKHYESAKLYERRELYEAAAMTFVSVFDRYPDTSWGDDALLGAVKNFIAFAKQSVDRKQDERYQLAVDNYKTLVEIFPDSPATNEARRLIEDNAELAAMN